MSKVPNREHRGPKLLGPLAPQLAVQEALEEQQISRRELADRLGVSLSAVRAYINGRTRPRLLVADAICAELDLAWSDIWTYQRPEPRPAFLVRPLLDSGTVSAWIEVQMGERKITLSKDDARRTAERLMEVTER